MATSTPFFDDGDSYTGYVAVAVTGATFVRPHSTGGNGDFGIQPCNAGGNYSGVASMDGALGASIKVHAAPGIITEVTGSGTITAGAKVASDAAGRAVLASSLSGSSSVPATLTTGVVASNNAILWTARDAGEAGNGISVTILGSTGNSVSLAVTAAGNDITITPATNSSGVITSTAAQVITAVQAASAANALATVANASTSTGAGLITAVSSTNFAGGVDGTEAVSTTGIAMADGVDGALWAIKLR